MTVEKSIIFYFSIARKTFAHSVLDMRNVYRSYPHTLLCPVYVKPRERVDVKCSHFI